MALINPSGLYTGGKFNFNPQPYINIALQARQRKEARDEAIDKYYRDLPNTLNDKGVRDQEIPVINDYKQKIFEFGLKNKEALRNPKVDNGASQLALQKLFREAQGVTRQSQNAAKTDLELGKLWFNKDNQWVLSNDEFVKQHEQHNLPVTDPNYKPLDLSTVMANRPFDQATFVKQIKTQFPYGEEITTQQDPNDKLYDIVTTSPKLDNKTKEGIYAYAADKLHNDYTFKNKIQKGLDPNQLTALNEISQKTFGHPIENDEDLAAAYTVSQLPVTQTKQKRVVDTGAVMDKRRDESMEDWLKKNRITDQQKKERIRLNNEGRIYEIDNVPLKIRAAAKTQPSIYGGIEATDVTDWSDAELGDILGTKTDKYGQRLRQPIKVGDRKFIKILPNGFEVEDADGKPLVIEDKEVIVNTDKRTRGLEKPVGTGKAKIRTTVGKLNDL